MSDLFDFRVIAVEDATTRIHAETVHCDQHVISSAKNFALQLVVEAFWTMQQGYLHGDRPFRRAEAAARIASHPRRRELTALLELMHGKDIAITEAEYEHLRGNVSRMRAEGVSAMGARNVDGIVRYTKNHGPAFRGFIRQAEKLVTRVELVDARNHPRRTTAAPHATGTLVATFTDRALLSHLAPGLHWSSALYDFHGWEAYDTSGIGLPN